MVQVTLLQPQEVVGQRVKVDRLGALLKAVTAAVVDYDTQQPTQPPRPVDFDAVEGGDRRGG